jgi:hypothetical protein
MGLVPSFFQIALSFLASSFSKTVGLCFTDMQYVGYDPTMITDERGIVKSIKCCDKIFAARTVYETQSFVGYATEVEHEKKHFVLKDAWVEKLRPVNETEHLKHIAGVRGVQSVCILLVHRRISWGESLNIRISMTDRMVQTQRVVTVTSTHYKKYHHVPKKNQLQQSQVKD